MPRIQEPTLRENRDRRDADLRRAARALLDSEGPDGVSMGAVATAAGLSRAAAYEYFPSTADLVCAVIIDELRAWGRSVTAGRHASDSPEESVESYSEHLQTAQPWESTRTSLCVTALMEQRLRLAPHLNHSLVETS